MLPAVEGIFSRDDMSAVLPHQELDSVVERLHSRRPGVALLNDVERVTRTPAQQAVLASRLEAAVWVQAVNQAICKAGIKTQPAAQRYRAVISDGHLKAPGKNVNAYSS